MIWGSSAVCSRTGAVTVTVTVTAHGTRHTAGSTLSVEVRPACRNGDGAEPITWAGAVGAQTDEGPIHVLTSTEAP